MRTVVSNQEVCDMWARQSQDYARNAKNTIYFSGDTIYSYGTHFPIAKHFGDYVMFTTKGYSNTTAKHKCYVQRALGSGIPVLYVPDFNSPKICYDYFLSKSKDAYKRAQRSRMKERHVGMYRRFEKKFPRVRKIDRKLRTRRAIGLH